MRTTGPAPSRTTFARPRPGRPAPARRRRPKRKTILAMAAKRGSGLRDAPYFTRKWRCIPGLATCHPQSGEVIAEVRAIPKPSWPFSKIPRAKPDPEFRPGSGLDTAGGVPIAARFLWPAATATAPALRVRRDRADWTLQGENPASRGGRRGSRGPGAAGSRCCSLRQHDGRRKVALPTCSSASPVFGTTGQNSRRVARLTKIRELTGGAVKLEGHRCRSPMTSGSGPSRAARRCGGRETPPKAARYASLLRTGGRERADSPNTIRGEVRMTYTATPDAPPRRYVPQVGGSVKVRPIPPRLRRAIVAKATKGGKLDQAELWVGHIGSRRSGLELHQGRGEADHAALHRRTLQPIIPTDQRTQRSRRAPAHPPRTPRTGEAEDGDPHRCDGDGLGAASKLRGPEHRRAPGRC